MFLKGIVLQHFRSYTLSHFKFDTKTTFIVGANTAGKSNIMESIYMLSFGKSFRAEKDTEMIAFGKQVGRVKGKLEETELEVIIATGEAAGGRTQSKKYLVNGVPKRRVDFSGILSVVLFSPQDLEIIIDSPGIRRNFLDEVLEPVDKEYRLAKSEYEKGIRQRNALLEGTRLNGQKNKKMFEFWDELVVRNGEYITQKRAEFIEFINMSVKNVLEISVVYDHSIISKERLAQYEDREIAAGVTLVGPHRDDFSIFMKDKKEERDIRHFGSRGQQRLAVVQLKLLQMDYMEKHLGYRPVLLLDDIFSELDDKHINHLIDVVPHQQTIITTTHKEFIQKSNLEDCAVIELKLNE